MAWSGATASRSWRFGKRPSVNCSGRLMYSCGGSPMGMSTIHSPAGVVCAARFNVDDVGHGVQAGDGDATARLETFPVRMRMRVEEARQYRTTLKVDEPRRGSGLFEQRRVVADGRDVTRSHGDGLR